MEMNSAQIRNLIERILISAIFIYAILGKINFERTIEIIWNKNIPTTLAPFLLVLAIICLIFGSILFVTGFKQKIRSISSNNIFVPTTIIFHFSPFHIKGFLMNAGLIGGLVLGLKNVKSNSLK